MAFLYSVLSIFRHWHFGSNAYDLGIQDQALWHYSRFEAPACTISGYANLLGDHFTPAVALLAPLYWIYRGPETLLVAQALLLTLPMVPLFFFAQKRLGSRAAYALAVVYSVLGGVQSAAEFDFHEVSLASAFLGLALYFYDEKKDRLFFACLLVVMMAKEDMILLAVAFGLLMAFQGRHKTGIALCLCAFALFALEVTVVIPWLAAPHQGYEHWAYTALGPTPFTALQTCLLHPFRVMGTFFSSSTKCGTLFALFVPFFFTGLFSPFAFLTVPLLAERLLSDNPTFWGFNYAHYTAVVSVVIAFASADGLGRLATRMKNPDSRGRLIGRLTLGMLVINLALLPVTHYSKLSALFKPSFYDLTESDLTGRQALNLIPPEASVLSQSPIVPHLSERQVTHMMDPTTLANGLGEDYVIASQKVAVWPFKDMGDVGKILEKVDKGPYLKVFDSNGWVVFKKQPEGTKELEPRSTQSNTE
jgi:uncharacterized membrane protein